MGEQGLAMFGVKVCTVTWGEGCEGMPPPPGKTADTKLFDLCPEQCGELQWIMNNVRIKKSDGTIIPPEKVRVRLNPPRKPGKKTTTTKAPPLPPPVKPGSQRLGPMPPGQHGPNPENPPPAAEKP